MLQWEIMGSIQRLVVVSLTRSLLDLEICMAL